MLIIIKICRRPVEVFRSIFPRLIMLPWCLYWTKVFTHMYVLSCFYIIRRKTNKVLILRLGSVRSLWFMTDRKQGHPDSTYLEDNWSWYDTLAFGKLIWWTVDSRAIFIFCTFCRIIHLLWACNNIIGSSSHMVIWYMLDVDPLLNHLILWRPPQRRMDNDFSWAHYAMIWINGLIREVN